MNHSAILGQDADPCARKHFAGTHRLSAKRVLSFWERGRPVRRCAAGGRVCRRGAGAPRARSTSDSGSRPTGDESSIITSFPGFTAIADDGIADKGIAPRRSDHTSVPMGNPGSMLRQD